MRGGDENAGLRKRARRASAGRRRRDGHPQMPLPFLRAYRAAHPGGSLLYEEVPQMRHQDAGRQLPLKKRPFAVVRQADRERRR